MFLVASQPHHNAFVGNRDTALRASEHSLGSRTPEANERLLPNTKSNPMERSVTEYSQTGLPSPYPSTYGDAPSETSSADHGSAAQYSSHQEPRSSNYSTSATPTSEYGAYSQSARSTGSYPEPGLRQYHPAAGSNSGSSGDPSIAQPSPTYTHGQYSPYAPPPQDMQHGYPQSGSMYAQPRPDWANYGHPGAPGHGQMPPHHVFPHTPTSAPPGRPAQYGGGAPQVYSFVPIPGAQQHKRPRRRYERLNECINVAGTAVKRLTAH